MCVADLPTRHFLECFIANSVQLNRSPDVLCEVLHRCQPSFRCPKREGVIRAAISVVSTHDFLGMVNITPIIHYNPINMVITGGW